jgi:hypothetical protein
LFDEYRDQRLRLYFTGRDARDGIFRSSTCIATSAKLAPAFITFHEMH